MFNESQISVVEDAVPQQTPGVPTDKPKSALKLPPEREQWLVDMALELIKATETAIGRGSRGETQPMSFLGIRKRNMETHADNLAWRSTQYGGIFATGAGTPFEGGITRGSSKQLQRIMSAKITGDILGTTPFFGAIPARAGDPKLVKNIESFVQEKIEQAGIPQLLREAVSAALTRNEAILHASYEKVVSKYRGEATVAILPGGEPIRTPKKGFYIYENDDFIPMPSDVQGELPKMALKKDPSFIATGELSWFTFPDLEQEQVIWDGLRGTLLDNRDFVCPTDVNSIHDAKCYARRYDREWSQMREQYRGFETAEAYFLNRPESAAKSTDDNQGQDQHIHSDLIHWVPVAETYIRCDADEDGNEEEILLILDMENEKAIYYDYLFEHMKKRPNEVIVGLHKEPNSWAGVGVYSETLHANTFIDLTLNRVNKKDSQTGSLTCYKPKSCKEWADEQPLEIGGPEALALNEGYNNTDNPPAFRINLVEVSEYSMLLSDKSKQDLAVMFGASGAQSAGANDLDRSKTASGSVLIEKEGNMIVAETIKAVSTGIVAFLQQCVDIILENMDDTELFLTKEMELVTLNREEVRGIEKQVKLLLTKSRSAEGMALTQQAMTIVLQYLDLDPIRRRAIRDFVIDQLKMLEVTNAEEKVPEVTDAEIAAWQQMQGQANQQPPSASVSVKLADLTPGERAQVLKNDYRIVPDTPEQVAAYQAEQAKLEAATKVASHPPAPKETDKPAEKKEAA